MKEPDERDLEMRRLRVEEKWTLREIGERYNVSGEYVRRRLWECFSLRGVRRGPQTNRAHR